MAQIIDGKAIAEQMRLQIRDDAKNFKAEYGRAPGLAVVLVGSDPASQIYVRSKIAACEQCEINSFAYRLSTGISTQGLKSFIDQLNARRDVDGILVQLPLPAHLDEREILAQIKPEKDVDGFHTMNAGALFVGEDCLPACTPAGCMELIKTTGEDIAGKHAVVVGRSNIVGKPISMMLLKNDCTVTMCHSRTQALPDMTRQGDILVSAVGKKSMISGEMIKPGAIIIDVGINRGDDGKLCGDVDFDAAKEVASHITPVPGGVGPMTITMLLSNTVKAANRQAIARALAKRAALDFPYKSACRQIVY